MQVISFGESAALVEVDGPESAASLAVWARERRLAADVVPAARTVLLDGVSDLGRLPELLAGWEPSAPVAGPLVELEVVYDGPDLAEVAALWDLTVDEAIATHAGCEFTAAFCGFAPGFAYLTGLPSELEVPRLDTPRSRVPAGSVGVAGGFTGVYPTASPGGWRLLGRTDARLWDVDRDPPALLAPGTRVRFVPR